MKIKHMWRSIISALKTELNLFNTLVAPVSLYGCETWKVNKHDYKKQSSDTAVFYLEEF